MRGKHASAPKPDRRGRRLWGVVFWLALAVCIVAVSVLGFIFYSYWSAEKGYDDLAGKAFDAQDVSGTTLADMTVDWDYLRSVNGDVVAWVYVPGTNINYPVVQTGDNETYLTMDFNQSNGFSARCGSIFLDCNNDPGFADANNLLYGHHMNDGSMFAAISKQLTDEAQFNACRYVYVLTPDCNYQCETSPWSSRTGGMRWSRPNSPPTMSGSPISPTSRSAVWCSLRKACPILPPSRR